MYNIDILTPRGACMKIEDYHSKISLFYETNPHLTHDELAVVLTADLMYKDLPNDLPEFRKRYAHLDPSVLEGAHEGITFLRIAEEKKPARVLKDRLNAYLNVKFHDITNIKNYEDNAVLFQERSAIASEVIEEILARADFPKEIAAVLREKEEVRSCYDFYQMLQLFKSARGDRLRYEILRKIGLIVLSARIDRTVEMEDLEERKKEVWKAFDRGLRRTKKGKMEYYLWLNAKHKVEFSADEKRARSTYDKELVIRRRQARKIYPLQRFVCHPFTTFSGNQILHMEIRNKFGSQGRLSYTSYVEKMARKNLGFPNQVHDTIGVKIVVEKEDQIPNIIRDLESFLGGSSTRKMEKNSYHRFGRRRLSDYSSPEYFVWKAIYDITLPHPSISQITKMLKLTRGNRVAQKELKNRLEYFVNHPSDFVIEVQLQDIKSYFLSIAKGSSTAHASLKMNQIRSNSFYKFFPSEIYEQDVNQLKLRVLGQSQEC
jgi:hypothetical protein